MYTFWQGRLMDGWRKMFVHGMEMRLTNYNRFLAKTLVHGQFIAYRIHMPIFGNDRQEGAIVHLEVKNYMNLTPIHAANELSSLTNSQVKHHGGAIDNITLSVKAPA